MKRHRPVALAAVLVGFTFALPNAAPALGGTGTPVALEGTLRALHSDDLARGRSTIAYQLLTRSHGVVSLTLTRLPEDVAVGMRVRIEGMLSGHTLAAAGGSVEATGGTTAAATTGGRTTAVILFNFSNDTRQPWTTDAVRSAVFTGASSVNAYYQEQSFGRVSFVGKVRTDGDVYGWYTIPNASTGCDASGWSSAAKTAAQNAGVDFSGYQHVVYAFPRVSGCGWAGMAYMPGTVSWMNGYMTTNVVGHELGHNLGVHHAGTLSCTQNGVRVSIGGSCSFSEYGDPFDIMGQTARHMNTWHKAQLGWYDAARMQNVSANATFTLTPLESMSAGLQLLRVARGTTGDYYYLEYRRPLGFDGFASTDAVVNGISIRLGKDYSQLIQSQLLDATPATTSFTDSALGAGKTFTDGTYGISFTTQSVSDTGATVQVAFGGVQPPPPPPPPSGDTTPPTKPGNLRVTTTTTSSITIAWDPSTDNVGVSGYGIYRGTTYLGSATTTAVRLINLLCGTTYTFGVDAFDAASNRSSIASVTGTTTSCGATTDATAPSVPTNLSAQPQTGPKVTLAWTGSTDNVGVTGYRVYRGGAEIGTSTTASYTDSSVLAGNSYTYTVKAYDAAGNLSAASNSATATISGGGGGGGGLDTTAPTMPTGLHVLSRTATSVTVAWTASTDNVGVTGYGAYRSGVLVGTPAAPTYTFTGLTCGRWYALAVDAVDAAGNHSAKTSILTYAATIC